MKKKKPFYYFLIAFIFLFVESGIAQKNYSDGFVVVNTGDTLKGMVDYQIWHNTPSKISFRNLTNIETIFTPDDIKCFQINQKGLYVSRQVSYDSASINVNNLTKNRQPEYKQSTIYLQYIVQSNISLLSYTKDDRVHFFIQENDRFTELVNHRFGTWINGQQIIQDNKLFVEQLSRSFIRCSTISIPKVYSEVALKKVFIEYNNCIDSKMEVFSKPKTIAKAGVIACVAYEKYSSDFEGGFGYGAGSFVNFNFPNRNYLLSLYSELIYRKTGNQQSSSGTLGYEVQSIQWSNIFRFRLSQSIPSLAAGLGIAFMGGLDDKVNYSGGTIQDSAFINTMIVGDLSWKMGNKLLADFRLESCDAVTFQDYTFLNEPAKRYYAFRLGIAWQF
jgi:hypothetical protein